MIDIKKLQSYVLAFMYTSSKQPEMRFKKQFPPVLASKILRNKVIKRSVRLTH